MTEHNGSSLTAHRPSELAKIVSDQAATPDVARWSIEHCLGRTLTEFEAARLVRCLGWVRDAGNAQASGFAWHSLTRLVGQFCAVPVAGA